ncbi:MAG: LTA synthase family protein [Clostridia bacterium]|nr:LTA synthase family protein [Clostridia bacterium]
MNKNDMKMKGILYLAPYRSLLITLASAFGVTFFTEITNRRSLIDAFVFLFTRPHLFFFNFSIIFFTLSISLFFKKRKVWLLFLSLLWIAFGITDFIMRCFRVTPFAATDLGLLESVWSVMLIYLEIWQMILIVAAILIAVAILIYLAKKLKNEKVDYKIAACSILASILMVFGLSTAYHHTGVVPDHFANLPDAYEGHGFAYCFTVGLFDRGIDKPDDYSRENVDEILNSIGVTVGDQQKTKPNIIIVQLESFFDVNYLKDISFSKNPVPNFTALKEKYSNGFLSVPSIGSGTANTEFEILTGMNLEYFGTAEYPYKTILQDNTCETIAYNLREQGYTSHAIHNHTGTFYDRNTVYANLGFDTFTSVEYMDNVRRNLIGWAKDEVLTDEIIAALNSTASQDLVYAISVQAHGRYPRESEEYLGSIEVYGTEDEGENTAYKYFVNQLSETDKFIGALAEKLSKSSEPYILVFFGDHLPSLEIEDDDLTAGDLYSTEYVIVSNLEKERRIKDLESYQLSAYIMELANFSNGIFTKLHQTYSKSENYQNALEMLEYDVLYGDYGAYNGKQKYLPTQIKMGVRDIEIDDIKIDEEGLTVTGNNFTEFSVITIDGKRVKTQFVSKYCLKTAEVEIDEYDETSRIIAVSQYTKNGEFLSMVEYKK